MNNLPFMITILGIGILIGINLIIILSAWENLVDPLGLRSTSMILIYTGAIISYVILSTIFIILMIGFILYLVGYGKADDSITKYLVKLLGYNQLDAAKITSQIGSEGILFYNETMTKDINNANSIRIHFSTPGEIFKSVMIIIYTFALVLLFIMGLVAIILIDPNSIPNNSGYGLLISSVVVSGLSLLLLGIIYFGMYRASKKRLAKVDEDKAHISSLINKDKPVVEVTKLESGLFGVL